MSLWFKKKKKCLLSHDLDTSSFTVCKFPSELCLLPPDFLRAMLFPGFGTSELETLLEGTIWENLGRAFREIASDLACKISALET